MKKIISLTVALTLLLSLLISCGETGRRYDKEEVEAAAEELIRKSEDLNRIFWGEGISYTDNEDTQNGFYYAASQADLDRLGISSISDLKVKTLETFSLGYSESIFYTILSSLGDEDTGIVGYTRYFQGENTIMVYSKYIPLLEDKVTYLYDTLKATHSKDELVFVDIDVKIKRGEDEQTRTISIGLIEESSGWRIDTPTYATFRENTSEK